MAKKYKKKFAINNSTPEMVEMMELAIEGQEIEAQYELFTEGKGIDYEEADAEARRSLMVNALFN